MANRDSKPTANAVGSHFAVLAGGFYAVECPPEPPFTVSTPLKPIPSRRRHPQRRWHPFRAAVGTLNAVETRTRDSGENLNRVETHNEDKETNNNE